MVLHAIHEWWIREGEQERDNYEEQVYPESFSPRSLRESDDRASWFTMFALGCFHAFGRTQDGQHRGFIDRGWQEGWWREIAESRPPDENEPWLERLEGWSRPDQFDQEFLIWKRMFVDLYTIARGLPQYIEVFSKLPSIVKDRGPVSLNDVLQPSYSPVIGPLGLDAAPLHRSFGIGANWLIRELVRNRVYNPDEAALMARYCWMPSLRVRTLLERLGMAGVSANTEYSQAIYEFIVERLGTEGARFDGDYDLALQIVTRAGYREVLQQCFGRGGLDAPSFPDDANDTEDDFDGS